MKNSSNFDLEIHESHIFRTKNRRNKKHLWFLLILLLALAIYFAVPKFIKLPAMVKSEQSMTTKAQVIKTIPLSNVENLKTKPRLTK